MRPICTIFFAGAMILAGLSFNSSVNIAVNESSLAEPGFAVVELFTSEGCSSCPPADELAITLSKEYTGNVYFLGYHVDYWNYIGWKDKFSKAEYTERQRKYAAAFRLNSIYTPQVVVNGKRELGGSDQTRLRQAIMEELKINSSAEIKLAAKLDKDRVSVSYATSVSNKNLLKIALVQRNAETPVIRGENRGRHLKHINVVREIENIVIDNKGSGEISFKIPNGLAASNIKLIAFIQGKDDLGMMAATEVVFR